MIFGREAERERIGDLLERVRQGGGGALLIRGEPGIGKTAILRSAAEAAADFLILSATGVETEVGWAYGGLSDLLKPLVPLLDRLPERQAGALAAALGLRGDSADEALSAAAAFSLVTTAAEQQPVLLLIDDAPWLDDASREVALFLARRSDLGRFGAVIAARDADAIPLNLRNIEEIVLSGLSRCEGALLIEATTSVEPGADVARALVEQTAGNPLALSEAARLLPAAQLIGSEPLREPLPSGRSIVRIYARLIDELDPAAQAAVLTAAATELRDLRVLSRAAAILDADADAFARAEVAEIVAIESGEVAFRHPLLRSVAYQQAGAGRRRAAHRALAAADADPERRARHLAAAATAPDEGISRALEQGAEAASRRGALSSAATSLALAARLSADENRRPARLLAAARAAQMAGQWAAAIELADQAIGATDDVVVHADAARAKGRALLFTARPDEEARLLTHYADRVAAVDRGRSLRMLCEASGSWFAALEYEKAFETMERCLALADPGDPSYVAVQVSMGNALGNVGRAAAAAPLQREAATAIEVIDDLLAEQPGLVGAAATAFTHLEEYERARSVYARWAGQARSAGALALLAEILAGRTTLEIMSGEWPQAAVVADELVRLATDLGFPVLQVWGHAMRADIAGAQGDELEREAQLTLAVDLAGATGMRRVVDYYAALARGKALLASGEYELAASTLTAVEALDTTRGAGSLERWLPDLTEALARAGRDAEGRAMLARLEEIHSGSGQRWAQAAIARLHGLLDDDFEEPFVRALALGAHAHVPFEMARTALCFGERLRRGGERRRSRAQLGDALATFVRLGVRPWAERAQAELRASGQTRAAHRPVESQLTPSERHVAELIAEGLSNREIATRLFVSVRTVEMHVSHAYRKLGIRSRAGLARHVLDPGAGEGSGPGSVLEEISPAG